MLLKIRGIKVVESLKSGAIHTKFVIESNEIHHKKDAIHNPKGASKDIMC